MKRLNKWDWEFIRALVWASGLLWLGIICLTTVAVVLTTGSTEEHAVYIGFNLAVFIWFAIYVTLSIIFPRTTQTETRAGEGPLNPTMNH